VAMEPEAQAQASEKLAGFVFDALVERARLQTGANVQDLDLRLDELGLGLEQRLLQGEDVVRLLQGQNPAAEIDRHFAQGARLKLLAASEEEQAGLVASLPSWLGWIEAYTPFAPTAATLNAAPAPLRPRLRAGLAAALAQEANSVSATPATARPWLLEPLLAADGGGSLLIPLRQQAKLARRLDLLLASATDRWDVLTRVVTECDDPWLLRYLCGSPLLFSEDALAVRLLARGSHRHVSCALYALHLAADHAPEVASRLLSELDLLEPEDAAPRVLDIYAQTWLEGGEPEVLRAALLRWLATRLVRDGEGLWSAAIGGALARDARVLRQVYLVADMATVLRERAPGVAARLAQRIVGGFFAAFTPAGCGHPLADDEWQARLGEGLALAAGIYPELADQVERFGLELAERGQAWLEAAAPKQGSDLSGPVDHLVARMLRLYGNVVRRCARSLWKQAPESPLALRWYLLLARVLLANRRRAGGNGTFGALEHLLPSVFQGDPAETLLAEAAALDQRTLLHSRQAVGPERWLPTSLLADLGRGQGLEIEASGQGLGRAAAQRWDGGPLWVQIGAPLGAASTWQVLAGLDALLTVLRLPLSLFGYRKAASLRIDASQLVLRTEARLLGLGLPSKELRLPLEGLRVASRKHPSALAPRVVGLSALALGSVTGTALLFGGLDLGLLRDAASGAALVLAALFYDGSCHRAYLRAREEVLLELTPAGEREPQLLSLLQSEQAAVLRRLSS